MAIVPVYGEVRQADPAYTVTGLPIFRTDTLHVPLARDAEHRNLVVRVEVPIRAGQTQQRRRSRDAGPPYISFYAPSYDDLVAAGALNLPEQTRLVRACYAAARAAVEGTAPWAQVVQRHFAQGQLTPNLQARIDSTMKALQYLRDDVGDGRLMKWVGDEMVVAAIKAGAVQTDEASVAEALLGYDFIVSNPPYVAGKRAGPELMREYANRGYRLARGAGQNDLATIFLEWAVTKLRPNGRLSFVITDKWMEWPGKRAVRELVADEVHIEEVIAPGDLSFFEDSANLVAIITASRGARPDSVTRLAWFFAEPETSQSLSHDDRLSGWLAQARDAIRQAQRRSRAGGNGESGIVTECVVANVCRSGRLADYASRSWTPLYRATPEERDRLEALATVATPLSDLSDFQTWGRGQGAKRVFEGLGTSAVSFFVVQSPFATRLNEASQAATGDTLAEPALDGRDVERWESYPVASRRSLFGDRLDPDYGMLANGMVQDGKHVVFPYKVSSRVAEQGLFASEGGEREPVWQSIPVDDQQVYQLLRQHVSSLEVSDRGAPPVREIRRMLEDEGALRHIDRRDDAYVERLPPAPLLLQGPRLVWADISGANKILLDASGTAVPMRGCYFAVLRPGIGDGALYYLGIFNSVLLEAYHKLHAPVEKAAQFRYKSETTESWPVVPYADAEPTLRAAIVGASAACQQQAASAKSALLDLQRLFREKEHFLVERQPHIGAWRFRRSEVVYDVGPERLQMRRPFDDCAEAVAAEIQHLWDAGQSGLAGLQREEVQLSQLVCSLYEHRLRVREGSLYALAALLVERWGRAGRGRADALDEDGRRE